MWIVTDSKQPITPPFYHEDLVRAVLKELSKDPEGLELRKEDSADNGTFVDPMKVLSRENRWLDTSHVTNGTSRASGSSPNASIV